jgi:hypothetical protein
MPPADESLAPNRIVRWMLLAGVVLFSIGLYFRYGLHVPPMGSTPPSPASPAPPATP